MTDILTEKLTTPIMRCGFIQLYEGPTRDETLRQIQEIYDKKKRDTQYGLVTESDDPFECIRKSLQQHGTLGHGINPLFHITNISADVEVADGG
jgi:predicted nucleotidyltransferase